MSRKENAIATTNHVSGQKFYEKEGVLRNAPIAFEQGKRQAIDYSPANFGNIVEAPSTVRAQLKVKGANGSTRLDSATLEQLGIATGKVITRDDLKILKGATITYYVSDRKEGEEFFYTPDDIIPRVAPRTGEFTSIIDIEPSDRFEDAFEALPDRLHTTEQSDNDVTALEEKARELAAFKVNNAEPIPEVKVETKAEAKAKK